MLVRDLREALGHLVALLTALQGEPAAADVARLTALLRAHGDLSVEEFCKRVEAALQSPDQAAHSAPQNASKPSSGADENVVTFYLNALRASQADAAKFEEILAQMYRDKKARKVELVAIADSYVGVRVGANSKSAALAAIRHKRNQAASMSSRLERIGEIF